jgi:prolipoprotein diacylglyceryltransferase
VDNLYRHPVQLYAAAGALLIFLLFKILWKRRPFNGVYLLYLPMFYGVLRFTTEFFREEPVLWAGLTLAQLFSLALVLVALVIYLNVKVRFEKKKTTQKKRTKGISGRGRRRV